MSDVTVSPPRCLSDTNLSRLLQALRDPSRFGPTVDIRWRCLAGADRIGIWLRPASSSPESEARDRSLEQLNLLRNQESLALFISSSTVLRSALEGWNLLPKDYDLDGQLVPNPDGATHLTNLSLSFEAPNRVVTHIDGFDEDPFPDVSFNVTIVDTLFASGGVVNCTHQATLNTETDIFGSLLAGLLSLLTIGAPFLPGLILKGLVARVVAPFAGGPTNAVPGGVGCTIAGNLPQDIMIEVDPVCETAGAAS